MAETFLAFELSVFCVTIRIISDSKLLIEAAVLKFFIGKFGSVPHVIEYRDLTFVN